MQDVVMRCIRTYFEKECEGHLLQQLPQSYSTFYWPFAFVKHFGDSDQEESERERERGGRTTVINCIINIYIYIYT